MYYVYTLVSIYGSFEKIMFIKVHFNRIEHLRISKKKEKEKRIQNVMNTLLKFEVHTRADCLAAFFDSDGSPCIQIFVKAGRKTLALFSGGALSQQINNTSRSEQFGPRWRINSAAACDGRRLHTAGRCRHFVPISFRLHVNKLPLLPL